MPETASEPWNATSTGWLYQPFASAARPGAGETPGAVASYWNERVFEAETLPALSVQVPPADAEPESGPEYVRLVQEATPDMASVPETATPTAWLYHPFASGPRCALISVAVGGVASRLIGTYSVVVCDDPFETSQCGWFGSDGTFWSMLLVTGVQPGTTVPLTWNETTTSVV